MLVVIMYQISASMKFLIVQISTSQIYADRADDTFYLRPYPVTFLQTSRTFLLVTKPSTALVKKSLEPTARQKE